MPHVRINLSPAHLAINTDEEHTLARVDPQAAEAASLGPARHNKQLVEPRSNKPRGEGTSSSPGRPRRGVPWRPPSGAALLSSFVSLLRAQTQPGFGWQLHVAGVHPAHSGSPTPPTKLTSAPSAGGKGKEQGSDGGSLHSAARAMPSGALRCTYGGVLLRPVTRRGLAMRKGALQGRLQSLGQFRSMTCSSHHEVQIARKPALHLQHSNTLRFARSERTRSSSVDPLAV
jgi:hypothetical protein